ncbi:dynein heavy chain 6, axonemal-like [Octopus vulgaris]|uniref:Dynein heavy chain 6, axonemal-like n=1 Tax=Octopus vulgaris TaxID=6645 RepID=A0AA36BFJ0_OCTVU|nr:dynein heavy chain 6, axonemal-like [Octopus vulgaris]
MSAFSRRIQTIVNIWNWLPAEGYHNPITPTAFSCEWYHKFTENASWKTKYFRAEACSLLDEKGRVNSLTTVLGQEVDRFNKLLTVIKLSLHQLKQAIHGTVAINRIFFSTLGFLTGVLQNYARKYNLAIDRLNFNFTILPQYRHQKDYIQALTTMTFGEELDIDKEIGKIKDGVLVHGLFMDGFGWDINNMMLADSKPGEMTASLPMMHLEPSPNVEILESDYTSPLYKTAQRAGVLSTTGHSTNFVFAVQLPSNQPQDYWIAKGAALICQLSD